MCEGQKSAEELIVPTNVVDLTGDGDEGEPPPPKRVKTEPGAEAAAAAAGSPPSSPPAGGEAAAAPLARFDDEFDPERPPARWSARAEAERPALRAAGSDTKKRARFADEPSVVLGDGDGARGGEADDARRADQTRILGRRMDRAIWDAFRTGDFSPVEALLGHGADAAYVRERGGGETALMAAAYHGRDDLARALLAGGADAAAADVHGHTAAHLARAKAHATLASLLEGVVVNARVAATDGAGAAAPPEEDAGGRPNIADPDAADAADESPRSPASRGGRRGDEAHPRKRAPSEGEQGERGDAPEDASHEARVEATPAFSLPAAAPPLETGDAGDAAVEVAAAAAAAD